MNGLYTRLRAFAMTFAFLATLFATPGQAALIEGADVWFEYDDTSLFGPASVSGNTISFEPANIRLQGSDGVPVFDSYSELLRLRVWAKAGSGFSVNGGRLEQSGSYYRQGSDSWADVGGGISVFQVEENPFQVNLHEFSDGLVLDSLLDVEGVVSSWHGETALDFATAPDWDESTVFDFDIGAQLSVFTTEPGSVAQVSTDAISFEVVTAVPLPGAVWLFGSALLGVVGVRRFRSD